MYKSFSRNRNAVNRPITIKIVVLHFRTLEKDWSIMIDAIKIFVRAKALMRLAQRSPIFANLLFK